MNALQRRFAGSSPSSTMRRSVVSYCRTQEALVRLCRATSTRIDRSAMIALVALHDYITARVAP